MSRRADGWGGVEETVIFDGEGKNTCYAGYDRDVSIIWLTMINIQM